MQAIQILLYVAIITTEIALVISQLMPGIQVDYTLDALIFKIHGHTEGLSLWRAVHEVIASIARL